MVKSIKKTVLPGDRRLSIAMAIQYITALSYNQLPLSIYRALAAAQYATALSYGKSLAPSPCPPGPTAHTQYIVICFYLGKPAFSYLALFRLFGII